MKHTDIILPKQTVEENCNGAFDGSIDDYYPVAKQLLLNVESDIQMQSEAIEEICLQLVRYKDLVKTEHYLNALSKEFKIRKTLFNSGINAAKRQIKSERKGEIGDDSTALINRVKKFLIDRYDIYFNIIANKYMQKRKNEKMLVEMNFDNIYCELKGNHISFSQSDLKSLLKSDFVSKVNVFRDYFETLPEWDGVDHIGILAGYIKIHVPPGSNEQDRFNRMFRKMLVRIVACSLEVAFNKQCFTLVHEKQNSGKSTFLRWLNPPTLSDYYTETIGTSKDDLIALTENFISNIDELSTLSKYDINALKSVMSKDKVKVRLPYGERAEMLQRRCSFVASTNRMEFLSDETGSVRWVCFLIGEINWDYKKDVDINMVWSQAYHLFKNNDFEYQLTSEEIKENESANKAFLIRSPEMDLIQKYLVACTQDEFIAQGNYGPIRFMTSTDVLTFIQGKNSAAIKLVPSNVGKSLTFLGFTKESKYYTDMKMSVKGYYVVERDSNDFYSSGEIQPEPVTQNSINLPKAYQTDLPY